MLRVRQTLLHMLELKARMPFRYGIATMTHLPHLMIGIDVEIDGQLHHGQAAENLAPKWFTKDPQTSPQQDVQQMLDVIRDACAIAKDQGDCRSVFDLWQALNDTDRTEPPLLWSLGVSLVERAVIDAFCRANDITFAKALRANLFQIDLSQIYPELRGASPEHFLAPQPPAQIIARHTVGLSDPILESEISADQKLDDGLPQSLEACIDAYGLTHFKIKLGGEASADVERLKQIAALLDRKCSSYAFTVDGNENYRQIEPFKSFWRRALAEPALKRFFSRLIFVEQPLHRDVALGTDAGRELPAWADRPPMIIDESGGATQHVPEALACGYVGTSHKNCKGVIKGIAAACLIEHRRRESGQPLILSAEDLSNTGPIALPQDLAVAAALGVGHVERNGHHYFKGLSAWPDDTQSSVCRAHPDLFAQHDRGFAAVKIHCGIMKIASINAVPFGTTMPINHLRFEPVRTWMGPKA